MIKIKLLFLILGLSVSSLSFGVGEIDTKEKTHTQKSPSKIMLNYMTILSNWLRPSKPILPGEPNWLPMKELEDNLSKTLFKKRFKISFKLINAYKDFIYRGNPEVITVGELKNHIYKKLNKRYGIFYLNDCSEKNELKEKDDNLSLKAAGIKASDQIYLFPLSYKRLQMKVISELYSLAPNESKLKKLSNMESLEELPISKWPGIEVNKQGHIISIDLLMSSLRGAIPAKIGKLLSLKKLHLRANKLTGEIPTELGKLISLEELDLSYNQLKGPIPREIEKLIHLKNLSLSKNMLTESIPSEFEKLINLEYLYLSENKLTDSIPSELGKLINLKSLNLCKNELAGSIPTELGKLKKLSSFELDNNNLTGSIPSELGKLINLRFLYLHKNNLTGLIPPNLIKLVNLKHIFIHKNQLTGINNFKNLIKRELPTAYLKINPQQLSSYSSTNNRRKEFSSKSS